MGRDYGIGMDYIRLMRSPKLRSPIVLASFAGWNDAGDAAELAVKHFTSSFGARVFAEIDPDPFFDFTEARPTARISGGVTEQIKWPSNLFSAASIPRRRHDLVLLLGTEPHLRWKSFCQQIVSMAVGINTKLFVMLGAYLADIPHTQPVLITGTGRDLSLLHRLGIMPSEYEGPTGIIGVLQDELERAGIRSISLWAGVPHYVAQSPSPKAALALVEVSEKILEAKTDITQLQELSEVYTQRVDELVAADEEAAAYVAQLEATAMTSLEEEQEFRKRVGEVSAEQLAAEAEKFLRDNPGQ